MKKIATIMSLLMISTSLNAETLRERDKDWKAYTKWAYQQSKKQLGKAKQDRACSKDTKNCTLAIYFVDPKDKRLTLPIDVYDLDGKLIQRQLCKFNEELDIRTCMDWDTAKTTKEVLENNNWWIVEEKSPEPKEWAQPKNYEAKP